MFNHCACVFCGVYDAILHSKKLKEDLDHVFISSHLEHILHSTHCFSFALYGNMLNVALASFAVSKNCILKISSTFFF